MGGEKINVLVLYNTYIKMYVTVSPKYEKILEFDHLGEPFDLHSYMWNEYYACVLSWGLLQEGYNSHISDSSILILQVLIIIII